MRGSTRKRGRTWTAYWDTEDPESGHRKQKSKGGFSTRKAAQAHLATVITATADGGYVEPSKQAFGRFLLDEWLPAIESTVRPTSYAAYSGIVRRYVSTRPVGTVPLRALSGAHLTAFLLGTRARRPLASDAPQCPHCDEPCAQRCGPLGTTDAQPSSGGRGTVSSSQQRNSVDGARDASIPRAGR